MSFWAQREIAAIILLCGVVLAVAAWFGVDNRLRLYDALQPHRMPGKALDWMRWALAGFILIVTGVLYVLIDPR